MWRVLIFQHGKRLDSIEACSVSELIFASLRIIHLAPIMVCSYDQMLVKVTRFGLYMTVVFQLCAWVCVFDFCIILQLGRRWS